MAVLDRVPVGDITAEARAMSFVRTLLTFIGAVLYCAGWLVAKAFTGSWFVIAWCAAAVKVGWDDARAARQAATDEAMRRAGDGINA